MIHAINQINDTLKDREYTDKSTEPEPVGSIMIKYITFLIYLPFKLIFNLKYILIFIIFTIVLSYFYRNKLNDNLGINMDEIGEWIINHYIFPQQTIDKYLIECDKNINDIKEYNKEITLRLDIDINDKWNGEYSPKYDEYLNAFNKQIFYLKENEDTNIRQLVLIGVTGTGKSLFGNRLAGIYGDDDADYFFGVSGDIKSFTKNISKLVVLNFYENVNISILDTPGIFDTENEDIINQNNLIKYLKGSGGINAFLLILKKERLSQIIQKMLKQFENNLGNEFWKHLIFIVNFWNERDRNGWNQWKSEFTQKIRNDFNLTDKVIYPLHIIGLNNYGSYKEEIKNELIPNIPKNRLNSDKFISPLKDLKDDMIILNRKLKQLIDKRIKKIKNIKIKCDELKYTLEDLRWFSSKIKKEDEINIDNFNDEMYLYCYQNVENLEINEIVNEFKSKQILNENETTNIIKLKTGVIDYKL